MDRNSLRHIRESLMISKSELAKKANISPLTVSRIENGKPCRLETQRKILVALGMKFSEKNKLFTY
ncbi:MAG: helix-turn-helix domain-containing protein [Proteobacteria bacterium]|nr:helix-turn-helix transcriptional regulator [Desulfobacteraceae bacterium]MBU4002902.1 helix-turn-helix domain-containing protein [Pseudomonadota bacterium]MBU4055841.1 helix-turn-helix domain-containing protein [Pseudomonadota bacterium]MBU4318937.1 helix-turn-helix domain-containing protein [Pseudomonadota bacterium]MBU4469617.1 helix-turn-helix domain-containing protein [Pseudomonadota bacterium]